MSRPNDAQPFLGFLPANTNFEIVVAAFSTLEQRVTVVIPGVGGTTVHGHAEENGKPKPIGTGIYFKTDNQVQAECWNEQQENGVWINYGFLGFDGDPSSYQIPFGMRGIGSLLFFVSHTPSPVPFRPQPINSEVRENILWMWNETGLCWKLECIAYVVETIYGVEFHNGNFGPMFPLTFRGVKSPRGCVEAAKDELRKGSRGMAIAWLQAGQLHNAHVQQVFAKHADVALAVIQNLH